jgi:predicted DNA-binding antitoxin AbrB/MazE fold protein
MQKSDNGDNNLVGERPAKKLPAVVEKIVKPVSPEEPEKVQIAVHGADDLYREIRVENTLENAAGEKVRLKQGAEVDVIIEAPPDAVEKKPT